MELGRISGPACHLLKVDSLEVNPGHPCRWLGVLQSRVHLVLILFLQPQQEHLQLLRASPGGPGDRE